jgi:3-hydroxyisobutyrate dehydrogenase-like beta-hydroxyacid dehydrogenase
MERGRAAREDEEGKVDDRVGFIGLGTMGLPMVANLARAGRRLVVHDTSAAALAAARELPGAVEAAASVRGVAERVAIVFTCLPDDAVVRQVYLGADGIAAGARAGLITCDCSTVSPECTLEVHRALQARGVSHLDTPMLGSQPQAVSGEIFFIVGGDAAHLPRIEPCLRVMGRLYLHVGPVSAGNRIKLMHNGLAAVVSVAVAETLATCVQAGVDPHILYEVIMKGGGMAYGTYWERRARRIADGEFSPTFLLQHMRKDATLALDHARRAGVPVPLLEETRKTYDEAMAQGWGTQDFSAVTRVIERRIGRTIAGQ